MTNWQTKKLGDAMSFVPTGAHSRNDMTVSTGDTNEVLNIHYGDIHTKYSTYVDFNKDSVPALKDSRVRANMLLQEGDLVVTDASEDYDGVGAAVELLNVGERKVIGGLHTFAMRSKQNEFAPGYTGVLLRNPQTRRRLMQMSVYSKVYGLTKGSIESVDISYPEKPEQERIVRVLEVWDEYIEKLEQKITLKERLKMGLMQQLLTGRRRLPGFNGGWSMKKLDELADCLDNVRIPLNSTERENKKGNIPYCGANGVVDYVDDYLFDEDIILIAEDGGQFDEYRHRPIAYRMTGKTWVNNHAHVIRAKRDVSQDYIFFATVHKNILAYLNGGTRAKLNKSELLKIKYIIPDDKSEQDAIASVINSIYKEIELLDRVKNKLTQQKKYLLKNLITGTIRTPENLKHFEVQS